MENALHVGLTGQKEITVTCDMMASSIGSGHVYVYATAMMIAGMEATAVDLLHPAHISSRGDKSRLRISLDIHKHRSQNHNSHGQISLFFIFLFELGLLYHIFPKMQQTGQKKRSLRRGSQNAH